MNYKHTIFYTVLVWVLFSPTVLLAQATTTNFVPLVGIPGVDADGTVGDYINQLYILSISVAAFLVVIKIIYAGVQYILSDVVTSKEQAKKEIQGALLGLAIVLGAVVILETVNPQLKNFNIFENLESVDPVDLPGDPEPTPPPEPTPRSGETGAKRSCSVLNNTATTYTFDCDEKIQEECSGEGKRSEYIPGDASHYFCYTATPNTCPAGQVFRPGFDCVTPNTCTVSQIFVDGRGCVTFTDENINCIQGDALSSGYDCSRARNECEDDKGGEIISQNHESNGNLTCRWAP